MRNLAGNERCDASIRDELEAADIEIVEAWEPRGIEVKARLTGKLGPFSFRRLWRYWSVAGDVPLAVAIELYEDPIGREHVRVGGHCGCPHPLEYGTHWVAPDGRRIYSEIISQEMRDSPALSEIVARIEREEVFAPVPSEYPGARGFVDSYHIDTARGLRLFADTIRRHGLDQHTEPEAK